MIRAIIIDKSLESCDLIRDHLENVGIQVMDYAHDGLTGLERVRQQRPDVVIVDLVLPRLDGVGVIETMQKEGLTERTRIFVVSALFCAEYIPTLNLESVSGYFEKPTGVKAMARQVAMVTGAVGSNAFLGNPYDRLTPRLINKWLRRLAVPFHLSGYALLEDAITLVLDDPSMLRGVVQRLYPLLAERHNATASQVERNMRHAIAKAWGRCRVEEIERVFGYTVDENKDKPTNREFIAMIADHVRMEREKELE